MSGTEEAIHFLRYHGGELERPLAEREAAVSMLIYRIPSKGQAKVADTLGNAIYYLRTGSYPLSRRAK